jgi:hypothetical protein
MFAMTLYKCGLTLQQNAQQVMPVWKLFLRDGVLWFLAVFGAWSGSGSIVWYLIGRYIYSCGWCGAADLDDAEGDVEAVAGCVRSMLSFLLRCSSADTNRPALV